MPLRRVDRLEASMREPPRRLQTTAPRSAWRATSRPCLKRLHGTGPGRSHGRHKPRRYDVRGNIAAIPPSFLVSKPVPWLGRRLHRQRQTCGRHGRRRHTGQRPPSDGARIRDCDGLHEVSPGESGNVRCSSCRPPASMATSAATVSLSVNAAAPPQTGPVALSWTGSSM